jgi:hypothetical protein
MKTLMLYQQENLSGDDLSPKFLELEGDYRHLNDVYINTYHEDEVKREEHQDKEIELMALLPTGTKFLSEPTKDWDFFIHCGFLP